MCEGYTTFSSRCSYKFKIQTKAVKFTLFFSASSSRSSCLHVRHRVGTSVSSRNVSAFDGEKVGQKEGCGSSGGESDHPDAPWWLAAVLLVLGRYSSIPPLLLVGPSAAVKPFSPSPSTGTFGSLGC